MSQLQKQVERLREKSLVVKPLSQGRPSLFLSPKDAAAVNIEAIYDAAIEGVRVLRQYDERFEHYLSNLLHMSSISIQRELKNEEVSSL